MSSNQIETDAVVIQSLSYPKNVSISPNRVKPMEINPLVENNIIDSVETSQKAKFVEPSHYNLDEFEYERNGTNPGRLVIFNHEFYNDKDVATRRGTKQDVNEIIVCFQRLGFNINEEDVISDGTVARITSEIDYILADKEALRQTNSLVVFFLSHGDTQDRLCVRDGHIKCSDIWVKFNDCEELKYKPKLFIFQACKGKKFASSDCQPSRHNPELHSPVLLDIDNYFTVNEIGPDMLLLYSTLEGNVSFRHPLTGTWFIQELCKNFSSYGRRDDVISLITRTIKCVSNSYYFMHEDDKTVLKQMPIYVSTLSRKFYLNRNKDRHLLLEMNRKQDEIYQMLEELMRYVKKK